MSDSGPVAVDLLLTGGVLVTVDDERHVIEPGAIAVTRDRIVGVFEGPPPASLRAGRTVDCTGRAVRPGFVDCHTHLFQPRARGPAGGLGGCGGPGGTRGAETGPV